MNERTCIVTRQNASAQTLIRFVIGPNNQIVPDLKANLPGRGVWISAHHAVIDKAIKQKAFHKNFKTDVEVAPNLVHIVDTLLLKAALSSLSMARKAGAVVIGATKVDAAIRSGQVILVLHAKETTEDGKRKIAQAIHTIQQQTNRTIKQYLYLQVMKCVWLLALILSCMQPYWTQRLRKDFLRRHIN